VQLSATIVSALDGDALLCQADLPALGVQVMPGYKGHMNHDMPFTTGEVGCFLSHYTIWHHMVKHGIPAALILEDDFDLQEDFAERLGICLQEAKGEDWTIMYIGRSPMENDIRQISQHVVEPGYTLWTVGYILRLEGARALIDNCAEQHMVPLDDFFSVAMGCGMDGSYNNMANEWSTYVPPILRGVGLNPPLVMPYVGSMFLSDTAMLRKRTRFVRDLPVRLPTPMPKAWSEALDRLEAFSRPPPPERTPALAGAAHRLCMQESDSIALGRRYQLVGSWDGWMDFTELERCGLEDDWYEACVSLPPHVNNVEFQVLADKNWHLRWFPLPAEAGIAGPSHEGHDSNWRAASPATNLDKAEIMAELRVRWKPTGTRALTFSWERK